MFCHVTINPGSTHHFHPAILKRSTLEKGKDIMPRTYRRKTSWGSTPLEEIERAASEVKGGKSIRSVAKERQIDRSTLRRYIKKRDTQEVKSVGYSGTASAKRVFSEEVEKELAEHIKKLAEQFHGISPKKCRELALELAGRNNIPTPSNWTEKGLAGKEWFKNFLARHHLSCRMPEATSLGRATAFNKTTVGVHLKPITTELLMAG
ncbi:uncharacterized protein LOC120436157 isoform X1 [Oreochromis aureus]|nr:uncharacterized protein LOC120436157 isoform X1 [Oreochromis aureus]